MSKSKYDVLSTVAIIVLIVSTVSAQRVGHFAYLFGAFAILSALGSLVIYIKAMPRERAAKAAPIRLDEQRAVLKAPTESLQPPKIANLIALMAHEDRRRMASDPGVLRRILSERYTEHLKERYAEHLRKGLDHPVRALYYDAYETSFLNLAAGILVDVRSANQIKFHPSPMQDPASVITSVVQKLCDASTEPRFEFVLAPDGSFKIKPISVKSVADGGKAQESKSSGSQLPN